MIKATGETETKTIQKTIQVCNECGNEIPRGQSFYSVEARVYLDPDNVRLSNLDDKLPADLCSARCLTKHFMPIARNGRTD